MNLSEMTTQFTGLMNRRDLTSNTALVSTFMQQAIIRVQRELRVPAMEKAAIITIGSPYTGLTIPSDLIELKCITPASTNVRLVKRNIDLVLAASTFTGQPTVYARQGGQWILGHAPVVGDVMRIDYYAEFDPLVNPTDENIVSIIAWDLIVQAALSYAADWFTDKRAQAFEARYGQILTDLQAQADEDELSDDSAVEPALHYPDDGNENYGGGCAW